jgi:hypothetical protein
MAKTISEFVLAGVEWGNESDYFINRLIERAMKQVISKMESEEREPKAEH